MSYTTIRVPMTFPIENRRIHIAPVADMAKRHEATSRPLMAKALHRILELYPDQRVLVHTVSYDLANYLHGEIGSDRCLRYTSAQGREHTLRRFRMVPGAVLLAPSMDRGIDLAGEACRVVVVAKVPFPYLGDRRVSARLRMADGQTWYTVQTVRTLVQMCGRGVRSAEDWCHTFILDKQFVDNIWKRRKELLPEWWREAIDTGFNTRTLLA